MRDGGLARVTIKAENEREYQLLAQAVAWLTRQDIDGKVTSGFTTAIQKKTFGG